MDQKAILSHFLPEGILDYFTVTDVNDTDGVLTLVLEENALKEGEFPGLKLHSKGFLPATIVQDFPIRKKACYLKVKRRRWQDLNTLELYSRDWNLIAKGTRMTSEFALFLKRFDR